MKRFLASITILVMLLATTPLVGCFRTDRIQDILTTPAAYEGKEVNFKGYVGNTIWISLLNRGTYELGDGSGTIWVITSQPPPQEGAKVTTRGVVQRAFKLGDRAFGTVVIESRRN